MVTTSGNVFQGTPPSFLGFRHTKAKNSYFYVKSLAHKRPIFSCRSAIISIDVGTGGTKSALVSDTGHIIATGFCMHSLITSGTWKSFSTFEQSEPSEWWSATVESVASCLSSVRLEMVDVSAITVTGQMQDVILIPEDANINPPPALLYCDARSVAEAKEIIELAGGEEFIIQMSGMKQGATSLLAKLKWLDKYDPEAHKNCGRIVFGGHDYVVGKLCGRFVTDSTTASTTGLTRIDSPNEYAILLLDKVGLSHWTEKLPEIFPTLIPCGQMTRGAAESFGHLSLEGIPVFHSCGDAGACTIGCGAGVVGKEYAYIGTSGWIAGTFARNEMFLKDARPGVFKLGHPDPQLLFKTGSIMTAGGNLRWAVDTFEKKTTVSWDGINAMAGSVPAGSRGLLYLPYLQGERCPFEDEKLRASLIGISSKTERGDIYRAVMEGVCFALRHAREAMESDCGSGSDMNVSPLRLVGGGAKSSVWPEIMASVLNREVEVLRNSQEIGVKGAAILAAFSMKYIDTISPTDGKWIDVEKTVTPDPRAVEKYHSVYPIYKNVSLALRSALGGLGRP